MAASAAWASLPSIIIVEILSYLSLTDKLNASATCRRWRGCLYHPCLWRSISIKLDNNNRRTRHLVDVCGRFVREVTITLRSQNPSNVREFVRIISIISENRNLEKLTIIPSSCQMEWPQRDLYTIWNTLVGSLEQLVENSRQLKQLSLGCLGELTDHATLLLPQIASRHGHSLQSLHLASVKEDPDSYTLVTLPDASLAILHSLNHLGLDYDHMSNQLLDLLPSSLSRLVIHVHGLQPGFETLSNASWSQLARRCPSLELSLNLLHSHEGAVNLLDLLRPAMPLAHLRMFFCQHLNLAAVEFVARHFAARLQTLLIMDGMDKPNLYFSHTDEDPFVMLAWRCRHLKNFIFVGYEILDEDIVAIARLRGSELDRLEIPLNCIASVEEDPDENDQLWMTRGTVSEDFVEEISSQLGYPWRPLYDNELHGAVLDPLADAETAYLKILQREQI